MAGTRNVSFVHSSFVDYATYHAFVTQPLPNSFLSSENDNVNDSDSDNDSGDFEGNDDPPRTNLDQAGGGGGASGQAPLGLAVERVPPANRGRVGDDLAQAVEAQERSIGVQGQMTRVRMYDARAVPLRPVCNHGNRR